jgi:hypothetical protein
MATRHLSLRIDEETFDRLSRQGQSRGETVSETARTLLEEGLRQQEHPLITFRGGPAGHRASVAGGPDAWEVIRVVRGRSPSERASLEDVAASLDITIRQTEAAVRYYADFPDEIDSWIDRVDSEAERAEAAWLRQRAVLDR